MTPKLTQRGESRLPFAETGSKAAKLPEFVSYASNLANIVLPDSEGCQLRLGSLWESSPAVVVFLRHYS